MVQGFEARSIPLVAYFLWWSHILNHPKTASSTGDQVFKPLSPWEHSHSDSTFPSFLELLLPKLTAELGRKEPNTLLFPLPFPSSLLFSALPPRIFILFSTAHFRGVAQRRPLVNAYRLFCQLLDVGFRETVLFRHLYFNVNGMLSFIDIIKRAGKMAQWSIYHIRIRTCLDSQYPNKSWNSSMHLKPQY